MRLNKASGCEVLIIDAEGADCEILASMVEACEKEGGPAWPRVVCFETRGFANTPAEPWTEQLTIHILQDHGYILVSTGGDSVLLHGPSMKRSDTFAEWADKYYVLSCYRCQWKSWPSSATFDEAVANGVRQWCGDRWQCIWCWRKAKYCMSHLHT